VPPLLPRCSLRAEAAGLDPAKTVADRCVSTCLPGDMTVEELLGNDSSRVPAIGGNDTSIQSANDEKQLPQKCYRPRLRWLPSPKTYTAFEAPLVNDMM